MSAAGYGLQAQLGLPGDAGHGLGALADR